MAGRALVALGAAAASVALVGSAAPHDSAYPARNGSIMFLRHYQAGAGPDDERLFLIPPGGGAERDITPAGFRFIGEPAWSPDGAKIAFSGARGDDYGGEVYAMNADGSGMRRLTSQRLQDRQPAWSPDGKRIAYTSNRGDGSEIYVMRANGTGARRLTRCWDECSWPRWSPDGRQIAFLAKAAIYKLYLMRSDGSRKRVLLRDWGEVDEGPASWSPDGRRIVFAAYHRRTQRTHVYSVGVNGRGRQRLLSDALVAVLSPDGRWLAFTAERNYQIDLFKARADGTGITNLTPNIAMDEYAPAWQRLPRAR
jgi:Tol biopolymer transport system component